MSQPRSSGMRRSAFVFTSRMRGLLTIVAEYCVGFSTAIASPPDADLRVVAQHEPVCARLDGLTENPHVPSDQAVDHTVGQVANARALEHDAVLDLRILNDDVVADRRERTDVRADDAGAARDDGRAADHRPLDKCALFDDHFTLDAAVGVDDALDAALEGVENQPIGLEHVLELAGVFPVS